LWSLTGIIVEFRLLQYFQPIQVVRAWMTGRNAQGKEEAKREEKKEVAVKS
jgi:hypothetical protein